MDNAYGSIVMLIERLHRHFLDVLRAELRRLGVDDINAVQALLLANVGSDEMVIRELKDRGYYQGSNVSYNIKKLTEAGYLAQERSPHDRRATILKLTDKGLSLCDSINALQEHLGEEMVRNTDNTERLDITSKTLTELERTWTDYIRYGR